MTAAAEYQNPPVHEVVARVTFATALSDEQFERAHELSFPSLDLPETGSLPVVRIELQETVSSSPQTSVSTRQGLIVFMDQPEPTRVLQIERRYFSYHLVRTKQWPSGKYVGWPSVRAELQEICKALDDTLTSDVAMKGASLRYLNRLAIPESDSPSGVLSLGFRAPESVRQLNGFKLNTTWAGVRGFETVGSNLNLAQIQIDEPSLREGNIGLLLDVEVHNVKPLTAKGVGTTLAWYDEGHAALVSIFESCLTEPIRARFRNPK